MFQLKSIFKYKIDKRSTPNYQNHPLISGEAQEECMEEGALESLAQSLPRDLGEFVLQNNNDFRDECIRWDKEQEERKRLEESQKELAQQQALSGNSSHASTSLDPNNDVLVSLTLCIS